MYQAGGRVLYGIHGVCDITDSEIQMVDGKKVTYLVLEPLGQPGSRYLVPMHNASAMSKLKPVATREELENLIRSEKVRQDCWIAEESLRKQTYRDLISSGDRERLMAMVHTLYCHRAAQMEAGRKVHLCDDNFLRDAEKLLAGEIAIVLDMDTDKARQYIRSQLKA